MAAIGTLISGAHLRASYLYSYIETALCNAVQPMRAYICSCIAQVTAKLAECSNKWIRAVFLGHRLSVAHAFCCWLSLCCASWASTNVGYTSVNVVVSSGGEIYRQSPSYAHCKKKKSMEKKMERKRTVKGHRTHAIALCSIQPYAYAIAAASRREEQPQSRCPLVSVTLYCNEAGQYGRRAERR